MTDVHPRPATDPIAGDPLPDRRSRILFLSGDRGTGKTTVYLTLRQTLMEGTGQDWMRNIVWLEPLDMEPLPATANLLAAVLVRIELAVQRAQNTPELVSERRREELSLLDQPGSRVDALRELSDLLAEVAMAWNGNLRARSGQLDPDSYGIETARAERARLSANLKFAAALEKLGATTFNSQTVFVLPVDDIDLNPGAAVPLLRMLRMVSNPRLVTLVLGNMDVLQRVVELKFGHDLAEVAAGLKLEEEVAGLSSLSADIGRNSLRKHLPPSQRVDLTLPTLPHALKYSPIKEVLPLGELLDGACVWPTLSARCFFESCSLDGTTSADYSGSGALSVPMRHLADLYADVDEYLTDRADPGLDDRKKSDAEKEPSRESVEEEKPSRWPVERWLMGLAVDGLRSSAELTPATAADLEIQIKRTAMSTTSWHLTGEPLTIKGDVSGRVDIPLGSTPNGPDISLLRVGHGGWRFVDPSRRASSNTWESWDVALSDEFAARLVAFHDAALGRRQWTGPSMVDRLLGHTWAVTRWSSSSLNARVDLPWSRPPLTTFRQLEAFLAYWRAEEVESGDHSAAQRLAFAWIAGGTAAIDNEMPPQFGQPGQGWPEVGRRLVALDLNDPIRRRWIQQVVELAMPEFALPEIASKAILNAKLRKELRNRGMLRTLQDRRRNRLGWLSKVDFQMPEAEGRWPELNIVMPASDPIPLLLPAWLGSLDA